MVVAQAGIPTHLGINSWGTQRTLTQLFVQVIPGLGPLASLTPVPRSRSTGSQQQMVQAKNIEYMPIVDGVEFVSTGASAVNCLSDVGSANRPITLSTNTNSRFNSVSLGTPIKTLPAN